MLYDDLKIPSSPQRVRRRARGEYKKAGTRKFIFPLMKKVSPKITLFRCQCLSWESLKFHSVKNKALEQIRVGEREKSTEKRQKNWSR